MKSISKKTVFIWLGSSIVANFILVWVIGHLCQVTRAGQYCDYNAFGFAYVFQAIIYGTLILLTIAYLLFGKYGSSKTSSVLRSISLVLCFIFAFSPIVMNAVVIIQAQEGIARTKEGAANQALLDAQNCAAYKAQMASFLRDGAAILTPPRNCR